MQSSRSTDNSSTTPPSFSDIFVTPKQPVYKSQIPFPSDEVIIDVSIQFFI